MTVLRATVEQVEELATKGGDPYWKVHLKGTGYTTFKDDVIGDLEEGMYIKADVNSEKKGKYTNNYFNGWELADGTPSKASIPERAPVTYDPIEVPPKQESIVPSAVWDAKDRATYMESAYKSAAKVFEGMGATKDNRREYIRLARWIYWDIRNAREDKSLQAIPDEGHA